MKDKQLTPKLKFDFDYNLEDANICNDNFSFKNIKKKANIKINIHNNKKTKKDTSINLF